MYGRLNRVCAEQEIIIKQHVSDIIFRPLQMSIARMAAAQLTVAVLCLHVLAVDIGSSDPRLAGPPVRCDGRVYLDMAVVSYLIIIIIDIHNPMATVQHVMILSLLIELMIVVIY